MEINSNSPFMISISLHSLWSYQRKGTNRIERQATSWIPPQIPNRPQTPFPFHILHQHQSDTSQNAMESTKSQRCVSGRTQDQFVGTDAVVGHNDVFLSSLEAHNTGQEQIASCNMGDKFNSHPAFRVTVGSSNDKTKSEHLDDRVSLIRCIALSVCIH